MFKNLFFILMVLFLCSPLGSASRIANDPGINSNFNFRGKQYKTVLPYSRMQEMANFDIDGSKLPLDISQIIAIGKKVVKKIDSEERWLVHSIGLYKYSYQNANYWYYQIHFRANNQYVYINIGLSGEEPDIYRIDEVLIN